MTVEVRISRRALSQVREAVRWWKRNRPSAPNAIEEELAKALRLISVERVIGARARDLDLPGIRRLRLARIGYFLYYAAADDRIDVVAFWHVRRGSNPPI